LPYETIPTTSLPRLQRHRPDDLFRRRQQVSDYFLKALAQILSNTLLQGEKIQLRGFGSFSCSSSGSAPPEKIRFIPAKQLLQSLNTPKK